MLTATADELANFQAWSEEAEPWEEYLRGRALKQMSLDDEASAAFKDALRSMSLGQVDELVSGHFDFYCGDEFDIAIPQLGPAIALSKEYGGITVSVSVDVIAGKIVRLYRLIGRDLDDDLAERCFDSFLWRLCLDMTGADTFEYVFIEAWSSQSAPLSYMLVGAQTIRQHRYPDLQTDCMRLGFKFSDVVKTCAELVSEVPDKKLNLPNYELAGEMVP